MCISLGLVAGIAVGAFGIGHSIASTVVNQDQTPTSVYQKNDSGQTYGSSLYAESIDKVPDLILARGIDGTIGYIKAVDANEPLPKTPEEALALNAKHKAMGERQIPLYAVDGKTVIGVFSISCGSGTTITAEEAKTSNLEQ